MSRSLWKGPSAEIHLPTKRVGHALNLPLLLSYISLVAVLQNLLHLPQLKAKLNCGLGTTSDITAQSQACTVIVVVLLALIITMAGTRLARGLAWSGQPCSQLLTQQKAQALEMEHVHLELQL